MPKDLLLFPFGGSAREALSVILESVELKEEWNPIGFVDDHPAVKGKTSCGVSVLGGCEVLKQYPDALVLAVPARPECHLKRKSIIEKLNLPKERFATVVHPSTVVAPDACIGHNTLVMPNSFISTNVKLGNHCVVLSNSVISHDSVVEDYCCLGVHVTISGTVQIEEECFIGSGVNIREGLTIGTKSFIGLGANVLKNVDSKSVVVGNPAKKIRNNTE